MKYFVLLHALLLWATANGDDSLLVGIDFPGSDIQRILAPDAQCCQVFCTSHPRCTFFTFVANLPNIPRFSCFLKRTDNGVPLVRNSLANAVSGFALDSSAVTDISGLSCFQKTYTNIDFLGSDIRAITTENPTECQDACTNSPDCQFFTYVTQNYNPAPELRKICFLKFSANIPSPTTINILQGVVSGFSQRDCDAKTCDASCADYLIPEVDFAGNDFAQVLAADAEHCQLICTQNPRCRFFTFLTEKWTTDNRRFFCYLKSAATLVPSITRLSNVVSGFSLKSFGMNKRCSDHVFKGLDFPGNDRKIVKTDSDLSCQTLCTTDPFCEMYTYATEEFANKAQRGDCYLKSTLALPVPPIINDLKDVVSGFSRKKCDNDFAG
ncbi:coagulation factor XI-like isoform X2 [Ambystoma mexicanum]|uniref:coagulation factor XI-like isoform X2 n=1 Tax=Ambystoma mexicanum TaxID=8296 RepID=UPI0037E9AE8D